MRSDILDWLSTDRVSRLANRDIPLAAQLEVAPPDGLLLLFTACEHLIAAEGKLQLLGRELRAELMWRLARAELIGPGDKAASHGTDR